MKVYDWSELEKKIVTCNLCSRLVQYRETIARVKRRSYREWDYWGKPVPGFGDHDAHVLIIGLAPGAHGSNRTGRMFTGDSSGNFLYNALYVAGYANQPESIMVGDQLTLEDVYISAVCRCAPPDNKPEKSEIKACLPYLQNEIALLKDLRVIVALGQLAFDTIVHLYKKKNDWKFGHGQVYPLTSGPIWLVSSYHPSRQNTQTRRLTESMFSNIWEITGTLNNTNSISD
jgi:uracil-DNA glycosylase family 4